MSRFKPSAKTLSKIILELGSISLFCSGFIRPRVSVNARSQSAGLTSRPYHFLSGQRGEGGQSFHSTDRSGFGSDSEENCGATHCAVRDHAVRGPALCVAQVARVPGRVRLQRNFASLFESVLDLTSGQSRGADQSDYALRQSLEPDHSPAVPEAVPGAGSVADVLTAEVFHLPLLSRQR